MRYKENAMIHQLWRVRVVAADEFAQDHLIGVARSFSDAVELCQQVQSDWSGFDAVIDPVLTEVTQ
jgi:hypothetical protein